MTVLVIATGGTIASHFDGHDWREIDGATLVAEISPHETPVEVIDIASGPSANLSLDDMRAIAKKVDDGLRQGYQGVVVTHGTDTIELTSFVVQLVLGRSAESRPVVFTGAMRAHSHDSADGPQNLRDSLRLASSSRVGGRGVMVCLDGKVHWADRVRKFDASSLDAFTSRPFAPAGTVDEALAGRLTTAPLAPPATDFEQDVVLVTCAPGMNALDSLDRARSARGVVVDAYGDLNVPAALWSGLHDIASDGRLVVITSRAYTPTIESEFLALMGVVSAGGLDAQRARLALMAALGSATDRSEVASILRAYALAPPYTRRSRV